jgi:ADP-L-glycero-D-manno-heptose 6-epimerase
MERQGSAVEAIVHLGANSSTTETDVDLMYRQNTRATLDLLQWCTLSGQRLIYASSAATYGDGSAGFDDDGSCAALAALRPLNAYGWSKHRWTAASPACASEAPLPPQCAGLKFFNVYGPNEVPQGRMRSVVARN